MLTLHLLLTVSVAACLRVQHRKPAIFTGNFSILPTNFL